MVGITLFLGGESSPDGGAKCWYSSTSGLDSPFIEALQDSILNGAPQSTVDSIIELINEWI